MLKLMSYLLIAILLQLSMPASAEQRADGSGIKAVTIFVAKKIITMERSMPVASAVAVAEGRIISVGSLTTLQPWMSGREVTIDATFKDKILMPGFIDPHVHPSLPAILTQFPFLAPDDWVLPTGDFPGATDQAAYLTRLQQLVQAYEKDPLRDPDIPFVSWGYHPLWHGDVYRAKLDQLFPEIPVILWHRSFHELIANTAALTLLGVTEESIKQEHDVDWGKGHFWELGAKHLVSQMGFLFDPQRYGKGMQNFVAMLHRGGVTSAMDMGTGIFGNAEAEIGMIRQAMDDETVATRIVLTPIITDFIARGVSPEKALEEVQRWQQHNSAKVFFDKHFKLMLDGAIFSGLARYQYPGYLDGHQGVWLATLAASYEYAETFWNAGYQIHAHTNGDASAARLTEIVSKLQRQRPRLDHRTVLEHFAYATEDQLRQLAVLGVAISANPYYQYILSDLYAERWLGDDRARNMVPLGAAVRAGMPIALHSDSPMAPLSPLTLVWAAVNRLTIGGNKNAESQKLSIEQALRAITIDAAWIMRREHQIGSIRAGKLADFVVLDRDPYKTAALQLRDIKIWGTVFEGKKFPLK